MSTFEVDLGLLLEELGHSCDGILQWASVVTGQSVVQCRVQQGRFLRDRLLDALARQQEVGERRKEESVEVPAHLGGGGGVTGLQEHRIVRVEYQKPQVALFGSLRLQNEDYSSNDADDRGRELTSRREAKVVDIRTQSDVCTSNENHGWVRISSPADWQLQHPCF